jgi:hypothetical protein
MMRATNPAATGVTVCATGYGLANHHRGRDVHVIVAGVLLLLIGLLTGVAILWTVGVILVIVGAVLWILGAAGREVGGRRHYY